MCMAGSIFVLYVSRVEWTNEQLAEDVTSCNKSTSQKIGWTFNYFSSKGCLFLTAKRAQFNAKCNIRWRRLWRWLRRPLCWPQARRFILATVVRTVFYSAETNVTLSIDYKLMLKFVRNQMPATLKDVNWICSFVLDWVYKMKVMLPNGYL